MVRFPVIPIVASIIVVLVTSGSIYASGLSSSGDKSSGGYCYAWKMRVAPAAPESTSSSKTVVETIISSRCKTEVPACRVVMEVICNGESAEVEPTEECVPCATSKCQDAIPVCRFVARVYKKGDCELAESEPCMASMKACGDIQQLRERFMPHIEDVCPQSAGQADLRVRVEPSMPLED